MKKEKLKTIIIIAMAIVILVGALFVFIPKYNETQQIKGAQIGYEQAIVELMQQASTCQPVSLYFENQTMEIIAVDCLNKE